jgi:hypothetical protein
MKENPWEEVDEKYSNLDEIFRLNSIREFYGKELFKETLELLRTIEDYRIANGILFFLGEWAMRKKKSSLYSKLISLLKRVDNRTKLKIIGDKRLLWFQNEKKIKSALNEYELKYR